MSAIPPLSLSVTVHVPIAAGGESVILRINGTCVCCRKIDASFTVYEIDSPSYDVVMQQMSIRG